jgi:tetratricopeptide (TPR) repeat protein
MGPGGEETYLFRHALTRQGAYELMPPSLRGRLHLIAADAMASLPQDDADGEISVELAEHLRIARESSVLDEGVDNAGAEHAIARREIDACQRAAAHLERIYRNDDAATMHQRVIDNPVASPRDQVAALVAEARVRSASGRFDLAHAAARRACDLVEADADAAGDRPANPPSALGVALLRVGRAVEAEAVLRRALALAERTHDTEARGSILGNLSSVCYHTGREAEAAALLEEVAALARSIGDLQMEGRAVGNLAVVLSHGGKDDERADAAYLQAIAIVGTTGNRHSEAILTGALRRSASAAVG